jgi:siroheme synthase (precorrin-2 oxidase/ferrochelatase)
VLAEEDIDRLAIRTGIGSKKAQELREAVLEYIEKDAPQVAEGQRRARERQSEADAKMRAESQQQRSEQAEARPSGDAPATPAANGEAGESGEGS